MSIKCNKGVVKDRKEKYRKEVSKIEAAQNMWLLQ